MRYSFAPPSGWSRSPFPPPQRGVYLRAPVPAASPESASILLFEALAAQGSLEEQLAAMVKQGCEGTKVGKAGKPEPKKTRSFRAIGVQVSVEVPAERKTREEQRIFVLVDTGDERLPVAFIGGPKAVQSHGKAFEELVGSIGHLLIEPAFYTRWVE